MTTNNPPIAAWAPSIALAKLASRHNNSPCVLTDGPAEFNDVALIRLSEYEALQAECEDLRAALAESRANDQQAMEYLSEVRAIVGGDDFPDMVRRCEKLRKDSARLDWLADPNNTIGNVQLPTTIVEQNLHSLRDAIDATMNGERP